MLYLNFFLKEMFQLGNRDFERASVNTKEVRKSNR